MSNWTISATRRSRTVLVALLTAAAAAFSQDSELVPISSITLYTLSATVISSFDQHLLGALGYDFLIRIGDPLFGKHKWVKLPPERAVVEPLFFAPGSSHRICRICYQN